MCTGLLPPGYRDTFRLHYLRSFRAFSSVVRQMSGYNSQRRGTALNFQNFLIFLFIVMYVPFSVFCVLFVCKCVLYCCHRVSTKCVLFVCKCVLYFCHRVSTKCVLFVYKFVLYCCHRVSTKCVLFVCNCVLHYCHRVSSQLQLEINNNHYKNIKIVHPSSYSDVAGIIPAGKDYWVWFWSLTPT
jgi:hypothetical protein